MLLILLPSLRGGILCGRVSATGGGGRGEGAAPPVLLPPHGPPYTSCGGRGLGPAVCLPGTDGSTYVTS